MEKIYNIKTLYYKIKIHSIDFKKYYEEMFRCFWNDKKIKFIILLYNTN